MSVFKQKNSIASVEFKKFKGIDTRAPHRENGAAYDMVNFRVLPDGSLQKRCGFETLTTCSSKVRGVWSGKLEETTLIFVVYGSTVAKILPNKRKITTVGSINSSDGKVNFMFFNGILYLSDRQALYVVTENSVSLAQGYVPLYGKDWPVGARGEVNEPPNLASRQIRMTYSVDRDLPYLCVDQVVSSIDYVYVNDVLITDKSRYFFDEPGMCICLSGLKTGDRVALYFTTTETEINQAELFSCNRSVVYGDYTDSILFLWDGERKNVMFASCTVSEESLAQAREMYPDCLPLYVPVNSAFKMPKSDQRITGVCRQYDRLLIFTDKDTWMGNISPSHTRTLNAVTVNPSYGCTSVGAAVTCENSPVCVSNGSIIRFTAETDELDNCNAYSISQKIDSLLSPSFFENAVVEIDKRRSEIFFADPTDEKGTLWIYNYKSENWYKFDGVNLNTMFMFDGSLGFVYLNTVFIFNESLYIDKLRDGTWRNITATFESYPTDLFVSGNKKRLCGMTLNANLDGAPILAEYISEASVISSITLIDQGYFPVSFIKRLNSKRFCYATVRLVSTAQATPRIYSTGIWAKP